MITAIAILGAALVVSPVQVTQPERQAVGASSSCIICHVQLDEADTDPTKAWERDVHRDAGLGCEACHGGDPASALAKDPDGAMYAAEDYKGAPDRLQVPEFCGTCHADAEFMKQYNPQVRVDQLAEYRTSVHGKLNAQGDPVPATCIDCHGAHGIRPVTSPEAAVYAAKVPETCASCHSDASLMEPYGIPTDQHEKYLGSVHAAALLERGDVSAPACNDCHGNHGAAPPGVQSVANVCGNCHGREAVLFRASRKQEVFAMLEVSECAVCHDNHRVLHPTPALFRGDSAPSVSQGSVTSLEPFTASVGDLAPGQTVEATWEVVLQTHLDAGDQRLAHTTAVTAEGITPLVLNAGIAPGTNVSEPRTTSSASASAVLHVEPLSGLPVAPGDAIRYRLEVRAGDADTLRSVQLQDRPAAGVHSVRGSVCLQCHEIGDECDQATEKMGAALSTMDHELRDAERVLHQAEIVGMDVSEVKFDLKRRGTTAAIEARALIHAFDQDALIARSEEAREVARTALEAGRAALAEHQFRRKGLAVSLLLIVLVLVGLFLKIRDVDRRRRQELTG